MTALNDARPVLIVFADQAAKQCRVGWYAEHDVARARVKAADLGLTTDRDSIRTVACLCADLAAGTLPGGWQAWISITSTVRSSIACLRFEPRISRRARTATQSPIRLQRALPAKLISWRRRLRRARPCGQRDRPKQKTGRRGIGRRRPKPRQGRLGHRAPLLSRVSRRPRLANRPDRRKPLPNLPISSTNSGPRSRSAAW